jgi:hypothetical protein
MSNLIRRRDDNHLLPLLLGASIVVLLAIVAAAIWSRGSLTGGDTHVASLRLLQGAYNRVEPGRTSQPQLVALGFDDTRLKARSLSGLGVQEYFMPRTSAQFDQLDPAVRSCLEATDRCSALVFPLAPPHQGGFMAANAAPREQGRIVFLLKSGRVAYKAMQGV